MLDSPGFYFLAWYSSWARAYARWIIELHSPKCRSLGLTKMITPSTSHSYIFSVSLYIGIPIVWWWWISMGKAQQGAGLSWILRLHRGLADSGDISHGLVHLNGELLEVNVFVGTETGADELHLLPADCLQTRHRFTSVRVETVN